VIYLIISLLAIVLILLGWGNLTSRIYGNFWSGWSSTLVAGLLSVTLLANTVGFFMPLNTSFEIVVILIGLLGLYSIKNLVIGMFQKRKDLWLLLFGLLAIGVSTFAPFINDHFGYYVGTVKWLSEYGIVKGISNINLVLGQQSSWHIFQASFDQILDPFLRINLVIFFIFTLYIFEKNKWALLLFLPFFLIYLQSPSPDLPVYCLAIICTIEVFDKNSKPNYSALWLLAIYLFTLKAIVFWLPLFVLILWWKSSGFKELTKGKNIVITSFLLILFFGKQLWSFGDFIFPMQTNLVDVSWKPSSFLLEVSNRYALQKTYDMQYSEAEILSWNVMTKVLKWFTLSGFKSIINLLIVLGLLFFGGIAFLKKNNKMKLLWLCVTLKVVLIFYLSGQYRFMLDAMLPLLALLLLMVSIRSIYYKLIAVFGTLAIVFVFVFPHFLQQNISSFYVGQLMGKPKKEQVLKPQEYSIADYDTYTVGKLKFYTPNNYHLMLDVPLPCFVPYSLHEFVVAEVYPEPYDATDLSKGFYLRKITPTEKQQLDTILKNYTIYYPLDKPFVKR